MHFAKAACLTLLLVIPQPIKAVIVTIGASGDTTIFQNAANNSYGGGPGMFVGTDGTSTPRRGLIKFDIASAVPAGAIITDVQLTLTLAMGGPNADTTPRTISLYRATADWGEGTFGTGSTIAGSGNGLAGSAGDATWNARHFDSVSPVNWTTPGGDASASASASTTVAQTLTPYIWLSTPALTADVQGWLDFPSSNFGWLIRSGSESAARTFRAFWTREASDPLLHPQLQITYVPEPGAGRLIFCMQVLRRSRRTRFSAK
jgi:hypothetical protein